MPILPSLPRLATRLALGVALLALPACAGGRPAGENAAADAPTPQRRTTVLVDNRGFLDMTIYVVRGGQRIRLGTANGHSRTRFTIPAHLIFGTTTLQFLADPIGGNRSPVSNEIGVSEGEEVELVINP
jgi:hypothetical protein